MDGPGAAGGGYAGGLRLGTWAAVRERGRRRTLVAPRPGPRCPGQTSHQAHKFSKPKKPRLLWEGVPRVPGGGWSEEVGVMTLYLKCPGQN